jgi:hypothetical protein
MPEFGRKFSRNFEKIVSECFRSITWKYTETFLVKG